MNEETDSVRHDRILVVDDNTANLQLLMNLLREHDYIVHPASDGELALEFVRSTLPDLILLDIRMPGMDGYEVCRRLKADEKTRDIPIIFISILEDERDKVKGFRQGAVDYITKPFQPEEVLARIQTHLRLRELTERLEQRVAERTGELAIANQLLQQEIAEHKRAEEALRLSEKRLKHTQTIAHLASWELDLEKNELSWSDEAYRIFGMQPRESAVTYEVFLEQVHPEDRTAVDEAYSCSIKKNQDSCDIEHRIVKRDTGEIRVVHERCENIRDESGRIVRSVGMVQDITERRQTDQIIALLNFALDKVREAAYLIDEKGRFHYVNEESSRALGYTRGELLSMGVADVDPDFPLERWTGHWTELKIQGSLIFEGRHRTKDGKVFPVEISANYIEYDGQGYNLALVRDITERKSSEEQLRANLRFFESMDRINRAIQGTTDIEQMMSDVLDTMLSVFGCDRAFLAVPCDPTMSEFTISIERTTPLYPGAFARGETVPMSPAVRNLFRELLSDPAPNDVHIGKGLDPDDAVWKTYDIKSQLAIALYPKVGKPWECGLHQCSYNRAWTPQEKKLFLEISRRIEDALTILLTHRDLQESERKFRRLSEELEQRVRERTQELERRNYELEQMIRVFVGRELKMVELKEKNKEMERKLGKPAEHSADDARSSREDSQ